MKHFTVPYDEDLEDEVDDESIKNRKKDLEMMIQFKKD